MTRPKPILAGQHRLTTDEDAVLTRASELVGALLLWPGGRDARDILERVIALARDGESAMGIAQRLNPPARVTPGRTSAPRHPTPQQRERVARLAAGEPAPPPTAPPVRPVPQPAPRRGPRVHAGQLVLLVVIAA